jgi:hypothetical protein
MTPPFDWSGHPSNTGAEDGVPAWKKAGPPA